MTTIAPSGAGPPSISSASPPSAAACAKASSVFSGRSAAPPRCAITSVPCVPAKKARCGAGRASARTSSSAATATARSAPASCQRRTLEERAARGARGFLLRDDLGRVLLQVVRDGLYADLDRARGLGGIQVLEREEQRPRALDDLLHRRVGRLVHAAFVALDPHPAGDPRHARGGLRR